MRHPRGQKKFGRSMEHRKALMKSLVTNLILAESIQTTLPKAKQARKDAERIVTVARKGDGAEMCILQWVESLKKTEETPAAEAPKTEEPAK